jgi:hypothetical protein
MIGLATLDAPFRGGILVPEPTAVLPLDTGSGGEILLGATWAAGFPPGFSSYYQYWILDPVGIQGLSASNALAGTTPD